ncbi:glutamyl-tRNA(Gln) amidotransferase subunit C, mitochondrial-like [Gigantopelta aegis]|uniref:glutamyl-tRNA(Gln) amidotransferase subunit C, mitochondrial-like n=1 Tax=Gigantopelta aegis TaxID=1735272 RepID=UPI001B88844A|nr:glutamyl-tRNA(Gln) amidotransferase subunit C, mitochondrial-like [Gigantopelta aegis]
MMLNAICCRMSSLRGHASMRSFFSKVPSSPTWETIDPEKIPKVPKIDKLLVDQLERLSLVEFSSDAGIKCLTAAIQSANQLYNVDTEGVAPLDTVLENRELYLRNDEVTEGNCKNQILQNASKTIEDYFVAPPGNIPLKAKDTDYKKKLS